mmetsp:Transcript_20746/g.59474  ORF Transcript_20746/g.59474 Transcript_20746/m.59474 type:complete len:147 (+) Transcript_20746:1663-2103(+)
MSSIAKKIASSSASSEVDPSQVIPVRTESSSPSAGARDSDFGKSFLLSTFAMHIQATAGLCPKWDENIFPRNHRYARIIVEHSKYVYRYCAANTSDERIAETTRVGSYLLHSLTPRTRASVSSLSERMGPTLDGQEQIRKTLGTSS